MFFPASLLSSYCNFKKAKSLVYSKMIYIHLILKEKFLIYSKKSIVNYFKVKSLVREFKLIRT